MWGGAWPSPGAGNTPLAGSGVVKKSCATSWYSTGYRLCISAPETPPWNRMSGSTYSP